MKENRERLRGKVMEMEKYVNKGKTEARKDERTERRGKESLGKEEKN